MCNLRRVWVVAVVVMALGGGSDVGRAQGQSPSAEKIRLEVIKQLQDHNLRRGSLEVTVMGSTVTLAGQVQSFWEKKEAIKLALSVKGVEMVASDLVIGKAESDKAIADQLADKVFHYSRYTIYDDITGGVRNGVITLDGWVTDSGKADDLADTASRIKGVQDLKNNLKPYPASQSDDRLRNQVARQILLDPDFTIYVTQVNPPIHVIVLYGRVTLKGYVRSALDKQKAEFIARSVPNVMGVVNQLQVAAH